jgi:FkbM family methyltransferase
LERRLRGNSNQPEGTDPRSRVIAEFARAYPTAFFVQVGSNDGLKLDPLRPHILARQWSGIMIEPVPYVFEQLAAQYGGHSRIVLENVAVADHDGTAELHYLPQSGDEILPSWYDALASFRKDVLLNHAQFIPDIATRISSIEVPCLTFESICAKHAVEQIDLVQIDTEGYDAEVIKLIDLELHSPKLLMFEHLHLKPTDWDACLAHLRRHGYEDISDSMDTVCLRVGALGHRQRRLLHLWRGLSEHTSTGHE